MMRKRWAITRVRQFYTRNVLYSKPHWRIDNIAKHKDSHAAPQEVCSCATW